MTNQRPIDERTPIKQRMLKIARVLAVLAAIVGILASSIKGDELFGISFCIVFLTLLSSIGGESE